MLWRLISLHRLSRHLLCSSKSPVPLLMSSQCAFLLLQAHLLWSCWAAHCFAHVALALPAVGLCSPHPMLGGSKPENLKNTCI